MRKSLSRTVNKLVRLHGLDALGSCTFICTYFSFFFLFFFFFFSFLFPLFVCCCLHCREFKEDSSSRVFTLPATLTEQERDFIKLAAEDMGLRVESKQEVEE